MIPARVLARKSSRKKTSKAEIIRLRHRYRKLILRGKLNVSVDAAVRLVGPDCAYHLYSHSKKNRYKG